MSHTELITINESLENSDTNRYRQTLETNLHAPGEKQATNSDGHVSKESTSLCAPEGEATNSDGHVSIESTSLRAPEGEATNRNGHVSIESTSLRAPEGEVTRRNGHVSIESTSLRAPEEEATNRNGHVSIESTSMLAPEEEVRNRNGHVSIESTSMLAPEEEVTNRNGHVSIESTSLLAPEEEVRNSDGHVSIESTSLLAPEEEATNSDGHVNIESTSLRTPEEEANSDVHVSIESNILEGHLCNETKNKFFNDIYENKLDLKNKFSDAERQDIHEAVDRQLKLLAQTIGEQDNRLAIEEVIAVGSAREGTQIIRPCEYDYILTLKHLSKLGAVSIGTNNRNTSNLEYLFVSLEDNDLKSRFREILTTQNRLRCTRFLDRNKGYRHLLYIRLLSWIGKGLGLRDLLFRSINESVIISSRTAIQMRTGTLRTVVSKLEEHGPAFTIKLLWTRDTLENHPNLEISVDLVPALKLCWEMYQHLMTNISGFAVNIFYHVGREESPSMLLMPRYKLGFHVNFTEAELFYMRNLSDHHKKCYIILKYMLNGEPHPLENNTNRLVKYVLHTDTLFHSYSIKLVVWEHHYLKQCREENKVSSCIPKMLNRIEGSLREGLIHPFYRTRHIVHPTAMSNNNRERNKKTFLCRKRLTILSNVLNTLQNTSLEDYRYETFYRATSHHQMWKGIVAQTLRRIAVRSALLIIVCAVITITHHVPDVWTWTGGDYEQIKLFVTIVGAVLMFGLLLSCWASRIYYRFRN